MIAGFRHDGLRRLYETGAPEGVAPHYPWEIMRRLMMLDCCAAAEDMNLPGHQLRSLQHDGRPVWSVALSRSARLLFRFRRHDAVDLDLLA